jgi:uncharacterized membrane protein YphA (DoxX/SURF4 family)
MRWMRTGLVLLLAVFMAFMGVQKFGAANPVFQYIAEQSGIGLFEPVVRIAVGVAEIAAAILLLAGLARPVLRQWGALLATAITGGALLFHLSPWLGTTAPVAFDEAGGYVFSPMLFAMALPFGAVAVLVLWLERGAAIERKQAD